MKVYKKILNVLYQSDDNYASVSAISIASLLHNNSHLSEVNVYYCNYNISKLNQSRLEELVGEYKNAKLTLIDARPYDKKFRQLGVKPWHGVYVTWLKMLAFGDLKINTDRVLFINGHTIINGPLDDLIDVDFNDAVMALGYDGLVNQHKQTIGLEPTDGYYNCGIMLINHAKWLKERIGEEVEAHLSQKSDYVIADQDLCNVLFRGRIKTLPATFNFSSAYYAYDLKTFLKLNNLMPPYFYSYDELMAVYYSPKIIHSLFGIQGKPWERGSKHPQRQLWRTYLDMTPWKDIPMPQAKQGINWRLYDILPHTLFMMLYMVAVRRKYGR